MPMSEEEFEEFLATALEELDAKQEELIHAYGLSTYAKFGFDQEQASLDFRNAEGAIQLRARVVPIGSWSSKSNTWKWAWSNEGILQRLREQSAPLRDLATATGLKIFESPVCKADEHMAWELTAMAIRHLGALGTYRVPGEPSNLYLAITGLQRVGAEGWSS